MSAISVLLGSFLLVLGGVLIVVDGQTAAVLFGTDDAWRVMQVATGVREAYLGGLILVLAFARERRALGLLLLTSALVALSDFVLALMGPGGTWLSASRHAFAIPLVVTVGMAMLRSTRSRTQRPRATAAP